MLQVSIYKEHVRVSPPPPGRCVSEYLQWWNIVRCEKNHTSKLDIMVRTQDALDKQVWFTAVIYEPGKVPYRTSVDAELGDILITIALTGFAIRWYSYVL